MAHGDFNWYELATADLDASQRFYEHVIAAWSFVPFDMPGIEYRAINVGDRGVGGLMRITPEMQGVRSFWRGYIEVEDVDAMIARVKGAGGGLYHGPEDIPGSGRFAVCADPQGAQFMIVKNAGEQAKAFALTTPGAIGWHELRTSDSEAAWSFYSDLFGWEKSSVFDMGNAATYQTFNMNGVQAGGILNVKGEPPSWIFYATIDDINAAAKRIEREGAAILNGPLEVPSGSWLLQARDPQGAIFAVTGPKVA